MPSHNIVTLDNKTSQPSGPGLQIAGPNLPIGIQVPPALAKVLQKRGEVVPTPQVGMAMIDTGATRSVVDTAAVRALGINPVGVTRIIGVAGEGRVNLYPATFAFPGTNLPDLVFASVTASSLHELKLLALIGRDILRYFTMFYNGPLGVVTLSI